EWLVSCAYHQVLCPHMLYFFFFSSRRRHTRFSRDWSSDVCSSDLPRTVSFPGFVNTAPPVINNPDCTSGGTNGSIVITLLDVGRSEERRVGKECRSRGARER